MISSTNGTSFEVVGSKHNGCICNLPTQKQIEVDILFTNKDGAAS
jgi:hypothetical protein